MADLIKDLKALESPFIVLLLVKANNYMSSDLTALRTLANKKSKNGIYITVNKTYETMKSLLVKNKINIKNLFFIDMISEEIHPEKEQKENCFFLKSPNSLTDLGIVLEEAVSAIPGNKYLLLDTLSTLLVYNHTTTVEKFVHFLTIKMRQWNLDGVIISLEKETDDSLRAQLAQFCDKVINA